jgi:hypothetical protein
LLFKFKTANPTDDRRYAQLKIRLNVKPDEFTFEMKKELIGKIFLLNQLTYMYGALKCHYVAPEKKFKTTVFVKTKADCLKLLSHIIPLSGEDFVEKNVSYTETADRDSLTRRKKPLEEETLNPRESRAVVEMRLSAAYLQINGFDKQIKIY